MNIRTKLTVRFILIAAIIFLLSSVLIYILSAQYREEDFYSRLFNKSNNTAKLLIEVDEVDVDLLYKIERDNPVSLPNEKIIIYNYRDTILFTTDEEGIIKIDKQLLNRIRLEDEIRFAQDKYEILGFLFKGQYDRFVVIAAATDIYGHKRLKNLIFILFVVFSISIVIVSISGWIYAGRALKPIANVVNKVDEISISSLNLRVDEGNGNDEIARLAQTFNSMLSRLETSFITQKNFIANASHELRTPLTAITGQLEVTLLNTRTPEDYKKVLNSLLDDIKNLNNLSNRLLLLAQTSTEDKEKKMSSIRIDEIVWQAKEDLLRHHPSFSINIDLAEDLDDERKLIIKGDEQLIKTALSNLMENGCKYSKDETTNVFIKSSQYGITIDFRDNGIGVPAEDMVNIFEPFYRGSNTKDIKGHGIGLSMVKGIVKIHNGIIQLDSVQGVGTTITVNLPTIDD
ncbi:HAMP domain-containing sensor histidine kinase [Chryseosolibacter indicus]|uniref:histidine kinase n=1 Tax=Chryseosolibacter indicus TaxID=2782351 RepID=A0ABS5VXZ4_9BACT|nr:ATP-binding protein [Chryseosolibacter indicus]MBT1706176.1 HAMP domain-containing protein [Chryseosolibacter indicus]